MHEEYAQA